MSQQRIRRGPQSINGPKLRRTLLVFRLRRHLLHYGRDSFRRSRVPEERISNSSDASFAKGITRVTQGRGVDCVLDSLSGELLKASWECLAPFGTFIEIGLRDILDNAYLDMRHFAKGTTFTFLNTFGLLQENADYLGDILKDAFQLIRQLSLKAPGPFLYSLWERKMMLSALSNKQGTVARWCSRSRTPVLRKAQGSLQLDPNATCLLRVGRGTLPSSRGPAARPPRPKALVQELSVARVKAFRGDVTDATSFRAATDQCERELPPAKGVVQMAMVLRDNVFETMSYDAGPRQYGPGSIFEIITEGLVGKVAEILQMPSSEVKPGRHMYRYGVDSLVALEVRNWISKEMRSSVALLEVLAAVPMTGFAATIADKREILASAGA
ncbi:hypothetical protein Daus18300_004613 [Diaporthe australafricana]|uniref:Carrier domain-containing protein n=1 Tax=Diaporthe australafricana TaxID=127596 RepID=A0ABR3X6R0_9PEZI